MEKVIAITEAYRVYLSLDEECKSRIPADFVKYLVENMNLDYGCEVTNLLPIDMQDISEDGYNLIAYMYTFING